MRLRCAVTCSLTCGGGETGRRRRAHDAFRPCRSKPLRVRGDRSVGLCTLASAGMERTMVALSFTSGTLEVSGLGPPDSTALPSCVWDARSQSFRAEAKSYADIVRALVRSKTAYDDR